MDEPQAPIKKGGLPEWQSVLLTHSLHRGCTCCWSVLAHSLNTMVSVLVQALKIAAVVLTSLLIVLWARMGSEKFPALSAWNIIWPGRSESPSEGVFIRF